MSNEPSEQPHNPSSAALSLDGSATATGSLSTCITGEVSHLFTYDDIRAVPVEAIPTARTLKLMERISVLEAHVGQLQAMVSVLEGRIAILEGRP